MGVVMGVPTLREVFDEKYYADLAGGILESFGRLFKYDLHLYICPCLDETGKGLTTVENFTTAPHLQHLYEYLYDNGYINGLTGINTDLSASSRTKCCARSAPATAAGINWCRNRSHA